MFPWNMEYQTTPHYIWLTNSTSNVWTLLTLKSFNGLSMPGINSGHNLNMSLLKNITMYPVYIWCCGFYMSCESHHSFCASIQMPAQSDHFILRHPQVWKEHLPFLARGITQYQSKGVCSLLFHRFLKQVPFIFFSNAATHSPLRVLSSKGTDCQQEFNCLAGLPAYLLYWIKWQNTEGLGQLLHTSQLHKCNGWTC